MSPYSFQESELASIWLRLLGALIDIAVLIVLAGAVLFFWGFIEGSRGIIKSDDIWRGRGLLMGLLVDSSLSVFLMAGPWQATVGQRIVGIRVVSNAGERVGVGRAIARYVVSFFSSIFIKLGYLIALFSRKRQTFHDMVARTVVVIGGFKINQGSTLDLVADSDSESSSRYHIESNRVIDQGLWSSVLKEYEGPDRRTGLWAYLFSKHGGSEDKAKAEYLATRVAELEALNNSRFEAELFPPPKEVRSSNFPGLEDIRKSVVARWSGDAELLIGAADSGSREAIFDLGQAKTFGLMDIELSLPEGYALTRRAAEMGDGDAAYRLSQTADVLMQEPVEAYYWALVADYRGVPNASKLSVGYAKKLSANEARETTKRVDQWIIESERNRAKYG
jgi:uncharacterized RDD family membrane protein YckC